AYEPDIGLERFVRTFRVRAGEVRIEDDIAASSPRVFSTLVHFDGADKPSEMEISYEGIRDVEGLRTRIEPNVVTAPGPPGSVDKGPREVRGSRLVISPNGPVRTMQSKVALTYR